MCIHSDLPMYSLFAYGRSRNIHSNISVGFSGTPNNGTPYPYYSHTTPIRIPKDMGMVWEAYHKGVPLLGVLGITLKYRHSPHALASSNERCPEIKHIRFAREQWGRATNTQQFTCGRWFQGKREWFCLTIWAAETKPLADIPWVILVD